MKMTKIPLQLYVDLYESFQGKRGRTYIHSEEKGILRVRENIKVKQ